MVLEIGVQFQHLAIGSDGFIVAAEVVKNVAASVPRIRVPLPDCQVLIVGLERGCLVSNVGVGVA